MPGTDVSTTAGPACPPVLLVAFNRPDTTQRVVETLRAARPAKVYFAVDGPRRDRAADAGAVQAVRELAGRFDWGCELRTLFAEGNQGCKIAVSRAISWFFSEVDAGIILEDDCIAHPSFFPFAAELLERYRDDERVMMISGDNFQQGRRRTACSYYFSRYTHIWGWATWRRAWRLYDHGMTSWPELRGRGWLMDLLRDRAAIDYWTRVFDETHAERNSSWAYRWMFSAWSRGGLTVLPSVNLVSNIGFGEGATHTTNRQAPLAALGLEAMAFPLLHPPCVERDAQADDFSQRTVFSSGSRWRRFAGRAVRMLRRGAGSR